jgi:ubiquinone/menaquinone biosynthesis C-methylase UbiE
MANFAPEDRAHCHVLDIGVGGGRHTHLLCDLGFQVTGTDISAEGLAQTEHLLRDSGLSAELRLAEMTALPFPDASFHGAISYGVYLYADRAGMAQAVAELHRILQPDGMAFIMLRSNRDYRYGKGEEIEPGTFRLTIHDTNEFGLIQRFLSEVEIPALFAAFREVHFERTETTGDDRRKCNSDWLITVRK